MNAALVRRLLPWLALATLAAFAFYQIRLAPVKVLAFTVTAESLTEEVLGTGTLEARVKTTISPRIQERLVEVLVDQGDSVKAGQLLARLDDSEIRQQVAIAEASLEASKQTAARVGADRARSEAVLAQARVDRQRLLDLLASNAVSQSDADKAAEALQVAEADLARSIAAIAEARGQVLVAEKTLLHRKEQLAFTRILAPYDGLVIRRDRDPGEMLVPGSSLLQLISLDEIWVSAWVDETAVSKVSAAMPARVVFRSEPGKDYPGVVSRVGRETDRETREFLVNVRVTEWPANWTIGQRAEVFIETARASAVPVIPEEWLVWRDRLPGVFVPVDGVARWREVALGLHGSRRVAVTSGLQAGDVVIRHRDAPEKTPLEGRRLSLP